MSLKLVKDKKSPYWYVRGTVAGQRICESTQTNKLALAEQYLEAKETQLYQQTILAAAQPVFSFDPAIDAELKTLACRARNRSQKRGVGCLIDHAFVRALYIKQRGRCCISGIAFSLEGTKRAFAPSLDRINNAVPYTRDNVRIVCRIANFGMNVWGSKALVELALGIVAQWENITDAGVRAEDAPKKDLTA